MTPQSRGKKKDKFLIINKYCFSKLSKQKK